MAAPRPDRSPGFRQLSPVCLRAGRSSPTSWSCPGSAGTHLGLTWTSWCPLVAAQLSLSGGLRLPGRIRRWSSLQPPEIRAVAQDATHVELLLGPAGHDLQTIVPSTAALGLLRTSGRTTTQPSLSTWGQQDCRTATTRSRCSRMARFARSHSCGLGRPARPTGSPGRSAERLLHVVDDPLSVRSAQVWDEVADILVDGAETLGPPQGLPTWEPAYRCDLASAATGGNRSDHPRCGRTPRPDQLHGDGCPPDAPSRRRSRTTDRTLHHRRVRGLRLGEALPNLAVLPRDSAARGSGTPPLRQTCRASHLCAMPALGWDAAWDALLHLGGGPASTAGPGRPAGRRVPAVRRGVHPLPGKPGRHRGRSVRWTRRPGLARG